jgi:hypothetical protein
MRYLAVAHFGRGRGDFVETEYPAHWRGVVQQEVQREAAAFSRQWSSANESAGVATLAENLTPLVTAVATRVLASLYPGSVRPGPTRAHERGPVEP